MGARQLLPRASMQHLLPGGESLTLGSLMDEEELLEAARNDEVASTKRPRKGASCSFEAAAASQPRPFFALQPRPFCSNRPLFRALILGARDGLLRPSSRCCLPTLQY